LLQPAKPVQWKSQILLGLILAAGLALRWYLLVASQKYVDGDEAIVGIQALDILHGHHSVFFAGELLAGSIEAYLVAPVFWLFGASALTLRVVPLTFSLLFNWLNYHLANRAYGAPVGLLSAAMVALGPLPLSVLSLKTWGGYIETAALGEAALLLSMVVLSRPSNDRRALFYVAIIGLLSGLATWMHPLYFYYLFTVGVVLLLWRFWRNLLEIPAFALPFLLGSAPLWLGYLSQNQGPAASSVAGLVPADALWPAIGASLAYLVTDALPSLWGLRPIKGPIALTAAVIVVPVYAAGIVYAVRRYFADRDGSRQNLGRVLLVFLLLSPLIFVLGAITNGNYTVIIPGSGLLSRYLVPLYTVLPIFVAALAWRVARRARWLAALLVLVIVGVNVWSHFGYDPVASMRSPFENVPQPASNAPLIDFLAAQNIRCAYSTHWIGYRVMFETHLDVQTYDYVESTYGVDRLARASAAVETSPEPPVYILFNPHWKTPPPLEQALDALGVTYQKGEAGDYVIYYRLSRRVRPSEVVDALVWPYWYS
jgi:hypothetical protein